MRNACPYRFLCVRFVACERRGGLEIVKPVSVVSLWFRAVSRAVVRTGTESLRIVPQWVVQLSGHGHTNLFRSPQSFRHGTGWRRNTRPDSLASIPSRSPSLNQRSVCGFHSPPANLVFSPRCKTVGSVSFKTEMSLAGCGQSGEFLGQYLMRSCDRVRACLQSRDMPMFKSL